MSCGTDLAPESTDSWGKIFCAGWCRHGPAWAGMGRHRHTRVSGDHPGHFLGSPGPRVRPGTVRNSSEQCGTARDSRQIPIGRRESRSRDCYLFRTALCFLAGFQADMPVELRPKCWIRRRNVAPAQRYAAPLQQIALTLVCSFFILTLRRAPLLKITGKCQ